jgi:hypothetical protein
VVAQGILALRKLAGLEEFLFNQEPQLPEVSVNRMKHCLLKLPNLHAAFYKNPKLQSLPSLSILTGQALTTITKPCTLHLRQLVLRSVGSLPECIALPELQVSCYICAFPLNFFI